MFKETDKQRLV